MRLREDEGVSTLRLSSDVEEMLFLRPLSDLVARLSYDRRLERAWQMLEREYADSGLTLVGVAAASCANKNHLNVLIRKCTGLTFHQLLIRYRLARALEMMQARNYSILEIALECGFGSITTFERNFRNVMGSTPIEFRRLQNK